MDLGLCRCAGALFDVKYMWLHGLKVRISVEQFPSGLTVARAMHSNHALCDCSHTVEALESVSIGALCCTAL